jgi:tRNA-modifying protein YgfZ
MPISHLADRGVVSVGGPEAKGFLDGLLTCDMDRVAPGRARFGALLTPQGKILFDFIVHEASEEGGYHLDVLKPFAPDLAKRLGFYKLRAKVTVADASERFAVLAGWDGAPRPDGPDALVSDDPRLPALGWRALAPSPRLRGEGWGEGPGDEPQSLPPSGSGASSGETGAHPAPHPASGERGLVPADAYHAHRIALGVPEGGRDFLFADAFPHEALMDQLHGVDFDKGCYVGQEVVSRMQHRGTARSRIVPLVYLDGFATEPGVEVTAGERVIGKAGTGANGRGLALLRLDRAADALAAGETIRAGGLPVRLEKPDWIGFPFPGEVRTTAA